MQFWCGTAFMSTPELPAVARMLDDAGDDGIVTGVMCSPWAGVDHIHSGAHDALQQHAERHRGPIERFAEEIVARCH
jgi:hypothetical protein